MPIARGTIASYKARARQGLQDFLKTEVRTTIDPDGRLTSQGLTIDYDGALLEVLACLFDDLIANESNTTIQARLTTLRNSIGV